MQTISWKNATPEQINLWDFCNGLIEWTTITPLYYQGATAGSEFLTYNAGKLYIALECAFSYNNLAVTGGAVTIYGVADALKAIYSNNCAYWDVTTAAVKFVANILDLNNFYFFRIAVAQYAWMSFNGYRLDV